MLLKLVTENGDRETENGERVTGNEEKQFGKMWGHVAVTNGDFYRLSPQMTGAYTLEKAESDRHWNKQSMKWRLGENRIGIIKYYYNRSVHNMQTADCGLQAADCVQNALTESKDCFLLIRDKMSSTYRVSYSLALLSCFINLIVEYSFRNFVW